MRKLQTYFWLASAEYDTNDFKNGSAYLDNNNLKC